MRFLIDLDVDERPTHCVKPRDRMYGVLPECPCAVDLDGYYVCGITQDDVFGYDSGVPDSCPLRPCEEADMREQVRRILYLYGVAMGCANSNEAKLVQDAAVDAIMHETQQPTVTPIISVESPVGDGWTYLKDMDLKNYRTPCSKEEQQ